ncbi:steroid dehydrogenase [Mycobacteroides abscessus subsp. abscessus]|nr:steroid dehydrogenase [Mycobacteroides abscessus subsp. abscessus]
MDWYTGNTGYDTVLTIGFAFAAFVIVGGLFAQSPYGRFAPASLGFNLSPKLGWWLMELPASRASAAPSTSRCWPRACSSPRCTATSTAPSSATTTSTSTAPSG